MMLRLIGLGLLATFIVTAVVVAYGYLSLASMIDGESRQLASEAAPPVPAVVTAEQLAALPAPAQRYFAHVGVKAGTAIPRLVRLHQKGRIRSSAEAGWMSFEADELYSTNPPAFLWRAHFPSHSMPVVAGRDSYLGGEGSIVMKMLGVIPIADEQGTEMRAAGLMRYLNEMTWFPAAMLGGNVTISSVDADSFGIAIADRGLRAEAVLFVDASGRPANFRATRFHTGTRSMETWETPFAEDASLAGLALPAGGAAVWKLPGGDLSYIELTVTDLSYE